MKIFLAWDVLRQSLTAIHKRSIIARSDGVTQTKPDICSSANNVNAGTMMHIFIGSSVLCRRLETVLIELKIHQTNVALLPLCLHKAAIQS